MKILFLSHYYSPEGNAPATRVSALAERWAKAGHDVTVVTCTPNVPNGVVYDGYKNRWCQKELLNGVAVVRVWTYLAANKGAVKRMFNFFSYFTSSVYRALRLKRPDVVIATSPQIFCGYAGVWVKRLRRVPLVLEIRDIWPESMGAVGAKIPHLAYKALEGIERAMYRVADHVVTVGEGYVDKLRERKVPDGKMSVIMNGTDLATFSPRPPNRELLSKYGLEGKFIISYIGTVGMACGLEVVLEAAEKLAHDNDTIACQIVFVIVGDGASRADLEAETKAKELTNVVFTGRQPKASMPDWVASSGANLVHLRKTDLFTTVMPSKIFESAGCARPVIMGVDGFAKQLVMDAGAGVPMEPENANELVACALKLAGDHELCEKLGRNAYENIAKIHNRDKQAADYLAILENVLAAKKGTRK